MLLSLVCCLLIRPEDLLGRYSPGLCVKGGQCCQTKKEVDNRKGLDAGGDHSSRQNQQHPLLFGYGEI